MKAILKCFLLPLGVFFFTVFTASESYALVQPQQNMAQLENQVIFYHQSGAYNYDIQQQANKAFVYLRYRLSHRLPKQKLAMVLDIDETSVSNYPVLKQFGFNLLKIFALGQKLGVPVAKIQQLLSHDKAILPTLKLYHYAIDHNIAVFFITGRPETARKMTITNLNVLGYRNYIKLYMRSNDDHNQSVIPFKTWARSQITKAGYDIVVNIGDQYSDLTGGFDGDRAFKYPNDMYYVK